MTLMLKKKMLSLITFKNINRQLSEIFDSINKINFIHDPSFKIKYDCKILNMFHKLYVDMEIPGLVNKFVG